MNEPRSLDEELLYAWSEGQVQEVLPLGGAMIQHVERLPDGLLTVWGHIVCEHCRLCPPQGDCRGLTWDVLKDRIVPWTPEPLYPDEP